jgi:hypothetical protein
VLLAVVYMWVDIANTRVSLDSQFPYAVGFLVVLIPILVRAPMLGVWRQDGSVIVRSWIQTLRLPAGGGATCTPVGYHGLLMFGESRMFYMLQFTVPGKTPIAMRGTIALRRSATIQAAEISAWLDREHPDPAESVRLALARLDMPLHGRHQAAQAPESQPEISKTAAAKPSEDLTSL